MQPVLEIRTSEEFTLWPVGAHEPYAFLPLSGSMDPADVGTAVLSLVEGNDVDEEDDADDADDAGGDDDGGPRAENGPVRPADPLGALLHGLFVGEYLYAAGGFRVTDTATGVTLVPGCCNGLEEWRDWLRVLDGDGYASFGHDPTPEARREGETVRLTPDAGVDGAPVIELSVTELRRLVAGAEADLVAFLALADTWAADHLPDHREPLAAALARALDLAPEQRPEA
ncbi:hypothetical protein ACFVHB_29070 [Kitasatospora sp. NPDC127111]|uniref:hypothetical protein n=1 Tax=Kitasatospora sp. NPDC127111 TaxID=3345363 RepID=UPI00363ECD5E